MKIKSPHRRRVNNLADAMDSLALAHQRLHEIDLRSCKGLLKANIKTARKDIDSALQACMGAIEADRLDLAERAS